MLPLKSVDVSDKPILSLDHLQERFSSWRANPQRTRFIPDDLWLAVIALCRVHSPGKVEKKLKLGHKQLMQRLAQEKSGNLDGMIELKLAGGTCREAIAPIPQAEIVSPRGMVLRLFSSETAVIIKAFLES